MVESFSSSVQASLDDFPRLKNSSSFMRFLLLPIVESISSISYCNDCRCYEVEFFIHRSEERQTLFFIPSGSGFLICNDMPFRL